jgi:PEGA domain/PDZ domain
MVATAIVFFPAAPFFLFMHGKDITIPKGTEITAYINGNTPLDAARFQSGAPFQNGAAKPQPAMSVELGNATVDVSSNPPGADIEMDGDFFGNTPSSFGVASGEHTIRITKNVFKVWERKVRTSSGAIRLVAELESGSSVPASVLRPASPDQGGPSVIKTAVPAVPLHKALVPSSSATAMQPNSGITTSTIGIGVEIADVPGAKITEVLAGSIAEQAGLHVGDIINSLDGKPVTTPGEAFGAISKSLTVSKGDPSRLCVPKLGNGLDREGSDSEFRQIQMKAA